ncbi:MAG: TolC family protein [Rikenellaceae bacterium]
MNKIKSIVVATLLCSSLSGCGLYSKFENPAEEVVSVDSLYTYLTAVDQTTSIASLEWRELFTDSKLQSLIETALENNTDLNVAQLSVEQAEVALKTARLSYLPSVNLQGSYSPKMSGNSESYSVGVAASWEIDLFGRIRNAKEQSKAAAEQSKAYRQAVQTQLIATVANSYYTLLMLDEQLSISLQTLKNWEDNLRVMEALKRAGKINVTSVLQSEASKVSLMSSVEEIERQIKVLESTISTLLAVVPQQIERGKLSEVSFPDELSAGLPIELLSNRPDVKAAEYNLAQSFYAVGEARSSLYPTITLSGSAGYVGAADPGEMIYSVAASLLQPIFNAKALRGQLQISKMQQEQALLQFKQTILDAGAEVNQTLIGWQSARASLQFSLEKIEILTKAVKSSELLMKHGNVNYLEVLTAQNTLLSAELSSASDRFDEIDNVIELYRALGGGNVE